jgi:hypothetical protein
MPRILRVLGTLAFLLTAPLAAPVGPIQESLTPSLEAQESSQVWVNSRSGVYHCPGSRYYGKTKSGEFMTEAEAIAGGNRPAYSRSCGGITAIAAPRAAQPLKAVEPAPAATERPHVWVNTRSGVYHCPGTQYYGNTKSGTYMAEAEARVAGHRPAYGRTCGG